MKLEEIAFSGAKGFKERQNLVLEDLNLIYGANSSGKSTVFQLLLLLQQSAQRGFNDKDSSLEFRGSVIDLGGFRTFVHGHDTSGFLSVELKVLHESLRPFIQDFLEGALDVRVDFSVYGDSQYPRVSYVKIGSGVSSIRFGVGANGELKLEDSGSSATIVDWFVQSLDGWERTLGDVAAPTEEDRRWLRQWIRRHECQLTGWLPVWSPTSVGRGRRGRPAGGSLESPRQELLQWFVYTWWSWAQDFHLQLVRLLEEIVYVGPLRAFPERVVTEAGSGAEVGSRGERLVLHLARRPELVERVNDCFKKLEIGYRLKVEQLRAQGTEDALGDVAIAVLERDSDGLSVSPADVGFGLSQILPVIVQLMGNTNSTILIEQPEIHLHPKMQARLADIVIESVVRNGNQVFVETHSEHLLSRIQRRLRERGPSLESSGVALNYVSSQDGLSSIQRLSMDSDGKIRDLWPDEFIDERIDDLFGSL